MLLRDAAAMFAGSGLETLGPMTWADLGCGDGTFTLALADALAPRSVIHAIDRNRAALKRIPSHRHDVSIHTHPGDFIEPWPFSPVDGILMANSLHYVANQEAFVRSCESRMTSPRRILVVEYDTSKANPWVPYPVGRSRLAELFSGFIPVARLPAVQIPPRAALCRADGVSAGCSSSFRNSQISSMNRPHAGSCERMR